MKRVTPGHSYEEGCSWGGYMKRVTPGGSYVEGCSWGFT